MQVPLEVIYTGVDRDPAIDELIEKKVVQLEKICDYIVSCHVHIDMPQAKGNPHSIVIVLRVPHEKEIVVRRESAVGNALAKLPVLVTEAFGAARRQLKKLVERQRGEVKAHPGQQATAVVLSLFRDDDYGFLKTLDGRDVYFHRNAVANGDFDRLEVGTGVSFTESEGDKGPQATTVQIVDKPGSRIKAASETNE